MIGNSRNLLMKFEDEQKLDCMQIYHSRNLITKFENQKIKIFYLSTTVEIY